MSYCWDISKVTGGPNWGSGCRAKLDGFPEAENPPEFSKTAGVSLSTRASSGLVELPALALDPKPRTW